MTIIRKVGEVLSVFTGSEELPNGMRMSPQTADTYNDADLNALGLYRAVPFVVPPGKVIAGPIAYEFIDGEVRETSPVEEAPPPPAPNFERVDCGLVRFTVAANKVTVTEDCVLISSVLRVAVGRYRIYASEVSAATLLPRCTVVDTAVRSARATARTASYIEIRTVDSANAPADVQELIVELSKVIVT